MDRFGLTRIKLMIFIVESRVTAKGVRLLEAPGNDAQTPLMTKYVACSVEVVEKLGGRPLTVMDDFRSVTPHRHCYPNLRNLQLAGDWVVNDREPHDHDDEQQQHLRSHPVAHDVTRTCTNSNRFHMCETMYVNADPCLRLKRTISRISSAINHSQKRNTNTSPARVTTHRPPRAHQQRGRSQRRRSRSRHGWSRNSTRA